MYNTEKVKGKIIILVWNNNDKRENTRRHLSKEMRNWEKNTFTITAEKERKM